MSTLTQAQIDQMKTNELLDEVRVGVSNALQVALATGVLACTRQNISSGQEYHVVFDLSFIAYNTVKTWEEWEIDVALNTLIFQLQINLGTPSNVSWTVSHNGSTLVYNVTCSMLS